MTPPGKAGTAHKTAVGSAPPASWAPASELAPPGAGLEVGYCQGVKDLEVSLPTWASKSVADQVEKDWGVLEDLSDAGPVDEKTCIDLTSQRDLTPAVAGRTSVDLTAQRAGTLGLGKTGQRPAADQEKLPFLSDIQVSDSGTEEAGLPAPWSQRSLRKTGRPLNTEPEARGA